MLVLAFALPVPARAAENDLYQTKAVVSGTGEARRALGFSQCLSDVLVKVSGDPRLRDDPRVAELAKQAGAFISSFSYRDRLSGIPIHDEQGSYDRPHDLTSEFDREKIDAVLKTLGREPWIGERPRIVVFLSVRNRKGAEAILAADSRGASDADMRFSLAAAAEKLGLTMELPTQAEMMKAALTTTTFLKADIAKLNQSAKADGGMALAGSMVWSDGALGWVVDWRLAAEAKTYQWQVRGVGFDDAFRDGMAGAAQILSGHGQPPTSRR
ncbi:DUF2066 domain-containing protein [Mesorhizobium zhangyense]|uniref:DUF2066 domain-containing protein n=1 Tax=Mesorhizobium zhangyense TaxID=1776730 RepID=UPI0028A7CE9D|nr:DUF2066 domain-containing protein [Mesorhizobium zhangyense]